MGVMICLGQGGLRSLSASSFVCDAPFFSIHVIVEISGFCCELYVNVTIHVLCNFCDIKLAKMNNLSLICVCLEEMRCEIIM